MKSEPLFGPVDFGHYLLCIAAFLCCAIIGSLNPIKFLFPPPEALGLVSILRQLLVSVTHSKAASASNLKPIFEKAET